MSADKRSVHTDALETLGTIITEKEARDAIHLGVEPVIAGEPLEPGEHIWLKEGLAFGKIGKSKKGCVGIVDPFLPSGVHAGDRFWLVVYPRKITSLRHVWEHPDFDSVADSKEDKTFASAAWITKFASDLDLSYLELMNGARDYISGGDYLVKGGDLEGKSVPDVFWDHYEILTGNRVDVHNRGSFFSCSC